MPATTNSTAQSREFDYYTRTGDYTVTATGAAEATPALLFAEAVAVQITTSTLATAVTAVVERSTRDPAVSANWAPADPVAISGNPSTGLVASYREAGAAWWRVRLTALTGTSVDVCISGQGAEQ